MILYGAGGHAKVILEILDSMGIVPEFIVDDNPCLDTLAGLPVQRSSGNYESALIAIGENEARKKIVSQLRVERYVTAIHRSAVISRSASIAEGGVVMQGAIVQADSTIGRHGIVNTGASVGHDCRLGDFVHIAPHATLCGNVEVGEGSWIGAGSVVKQGVKIGAWSFVGVGAAVVRDVPDYAVVVGVPAKIIKYKDCR